MNHLSNVLKAPAKGNPRFREFLFSSIFFRKSLMCDSWIRVIGVVSEGFVAAV